MTESESAADERLAEHVRQAIDGATPEQTYRVIMAAYDERDKAQTENAALVDKIADLSASLRDVMGYLDVGGVRDHWNKQGEMAPLGTVLTTARALVRESDDGPRREPLATVAELVADLENCIEEISAWREWAAPGDGPDKPIITTIILEQARATLARVTLSADQRAAVVAMADVVTGRLLDALQSMLNLEGPAKLGATFKTWEGLDVPYHFDKARDAIAYHNVNQPR